MKRVKRGGSCFFTPSLDDFVYFATAKNPDTYRTERPH